MTKKDIGILTKKVFLYMADLKKRERLLKGLTMNLRILKFDGGWKNGITPEMIAIARDYSLRELVGSEKFPVLCPFHNDIRHPNFYVKDNRGHCFACGVNVDSIDFVMKRDKLSFPEAIRRLNGWHIISLDCGLRPLWGGFSYFWEDLYLRGFRFSHSQDHPNSETFREESIGLYQKALRLLF